MRKFIMFFTVYFMVSTSVRYLLDQKVGPYMGYAPTVNFSERSLWDFIFQNFFSALIITAFFVIFSHYISKSS